MALIRRVYIDNDDDDCSSDEERQLLPEIAAEKSLSCPSLFGYQFAIDATQDSNFQRLIKNFDNLEM
ncbi:hypothetical protein ANCCAN_00433 [Ancylostoma caninum]|uniref:Uncharacterized protein n=1 Tax=Ancylostoma caninum TaxID=29170 RepID=A0A368HD86_ANCCA|nr:hypothetical protein ANCCAN_00433 [Ancylostoma caninum]